MNSSRMNFCDEPEQQGKSDNRQENESLILPADVAPQLLPSASSNEDSAIPADNLFTPAPEISAPSEMLIGKNDGNWTVSGKNDSESPSSAQSSLTAVRDEPLPQPNCLLGGSEQSGKPCEVCRLRRHSLQLTAADKLSDRSWQSLRSALGLPEIELLTAKQAGRLHHLLDYLVARSPLSTRSETTVVEWRIWLEDNLPEALKTYLQIAAQKSDGQTGCSMRKKSSNTARKNSRRKPVSADTYDKVAARQGSYCFWCGIKIIRESRIPSANCLSKNGRTVVYLCGNELREEAVGTIDHLVRVADGGNNDPANLVISCRSCNSERDRHTVAYGRPFAGRRVPCRVCGGRFFHPDWGCCSICGNTSVSAGGYSKSVQSFEKIVSAITDRGFSIWSKLRSLTAVFRLLTIIRRTIKGEKENVH